MAGFARSTILVRAALGAALALGLVGAAPGRDAIEPEAAPRTAEELATRKRAREAELEAIHLSIGVSEKRQTALAEEIAAIEADRAALNAELIGTAEALRTTEDEIRAREARLLELGARSDAIRLSLRERRAVLGQVLAALQRMGRAPPPALLARPEDALAAIRGSILAGAVLPHVREEAEALAADLDELMRLKHGIAAERDALSSRYALLGDQRARVDLLVRSKRAQAAETQAALRAERDKASGLAASARTLEELIGSLGTDMAAAEAARRAEEARLAARGEPAAPSQTPEERLKDTGRIAPALPFAQARGLLPLPVAGDTLLAYGDTDEVGAKSQGVSIATRPGARVVAPADGWIIYSGPFRSYGEVLILNAGDGYHVVLAGMDAADVELGQFVLAGEPIATMGATRLASLTEIGHSSAQPVLYVEFRKDGSSIDPTPWWAARKVNEVGG